MESVPQWEIAPVEEGAIAPVEEEGAIAPIEKGAITPVKYWKKTFKVFGFEVKIEIKK